MLTRTKIALSALLLAASVVTASAQTYEGPDVNTPIQFTSPDAFVIYQIAPQARTARASSWNHHAEVRNAHAQAGNHHAQVQPAPTAVYENGKYIGQDPDPNVRLMLERDFAFQ